MTHRVLLVKPCEPILGIDLGSGLSPDNSGAVGATLARALGIGALGALGATAAHERAEERTHGGEAGAEDGDAGFDDGPDEDVDAIPGRVDRIVVLESGDADDGDTAHARARRPIISSCGPGFRAPRGTFLQSPEKEDGC